MFNKFQGMLSRRNDPSRSPEALLSRTSSEDDSADSKPITAEGFVCPSCFLSFPTPDSLQNHYESSHPEVNRDDTGNFTCSACKMKLRSELELNSHYERHHASNNKDFDEVERMTFEIKALEESKALMRGELLAIQSQLSEQSKVNNAIREERDSFKLKSTKLIDDLSELKLLYDNLKSTKNMLESSLKSSEEWTRKLQVEIEQRPGADDVMLLQKELVSVQTLMNQLTLQREAEKETLQKQCNVVQETCLKLQAEKTELENKIKQYPKLEEISSLQARVSEMTRTLAQLQKELNEKKSENTRLQKDLEKCSNYQEIKNLLSEKNNSLVDLQRLSSEKDSIITRLKNELQTSKENMEEMKKGREKLFSKIEEGEGANAAMLQLKEENARLQEQFLLQQQIHGQAASESEDRLENLRSSLQKSNLALQESDNKCQELEKKLELANNQLERLQDETNSRIDDLNNQINSLRATENSNKAEINNLMEEIENRMRLLDQSNNQIETLKEQIKEQKAFHEKEMEHLKLEKESFERRLSELGKTLPAIQAELLDKENKLSQTENKLQQSAERLSLVVKEKSETLAELAAMTKLHEESKLEFENAKRAVKEFESTKVEFCDKISSLNEEKLQIQLRESELKNSIEEVHKELLKVNEKCEHYEEENTNLRTSLTSSQNDKNSLLSEIDELKKTMIDLQDICASNDGKIIELTEACQDAKANSEKVTKDASIEKELFLKDKVKLQKQIESLENDCAKQISQVQETVRSLENQLEESEEKIASLNSSLEEANKSLKQKDTDFEQKEAHHTAQVGVLTQNVQTLREDLTSEQKRRETLEQRLDEVCGAKLELDAKLENALDERRSLLERCLKSETECERLQQLSTELHRKYEDCVAALQELGREHQCLQVENMKHIQRKWAEDAEVTNCTACGKMFTVTVRKHHCRNCGSIFCNECSAKTATVAASKKPVRVCDICYIEVTK